MMEHEIAEVKEIPPRIFLKKIVCIHESGLIPIIFLKIFYQWP